MHIWSLLAPINERLFAFRVAIDTFAPTPLSLFFTISASLSAALLNDILMHASYLIPPNHTHAASATIFLAFSTILFSPVLFRRLGREKIIVLQFYLFLLTLVLRTCSSSTPSRGGLGTRSSQCSWSYGCPIFGRLVRLVIPDAAGK